MNLGEFKKHIESFDNSTIFKFGISKPFCWRGDSEEVCFSILEKETSKIDVLENINLAYTRAFFDRYGQEYNYEDSTFINFEKSENDLSENQSYTYILVEKLEPVIEYTIEQRLVELAFC